MKNLIKLSLTISCFLWIFASINAQERTKKIDKKIKRGIEKLWEGQLIEEEGIATDVSYEFELFFEKNQLHKLTKNGKFQGYLLFRRGYGCQIGGCGTGSYAEGATCSANGGTYETFDYIVFFDKELAVLKMEVVDYPGDYGYEICSKNWLKQFIGYKGRELQYKSDIDGISGATISANSITEDIQEVHRYITKLINFKRKVLLTGATESGRK